MESESIAEPIPVIGSCCFYTPLTAFGQGNVEMCRQPFYVLGFEHPAAAKASLRFGDILVYDRVLNAIRLDAQQTGDFFQTSFHDWFLQKQWDTRQ